MCFVMHDNILRNVQDFKENLKFSIVKKLNSQKMGKYYHHLYCSDVYNLTQKLDNSVQIVKITGHA